MESVDNIHGKAIPIMRGPGWSTLLARGDGAKSQHGRRHRCNSCNYETDNVSHMKDHIRIHTGERPYQCQLCPRSFTRKAHLVYHDAWKDFDFAVLTEGPVSYSNTAFSREFVGPVGPAGLRRADGREEFTVLSFIGPSGSAAKSKFLSRVTAGPRHEGRSQQQ
ncbi:hypothetical protein HPB51_025179 [Rhipicephalus microplus]|uniref:C2H2-type domain-containing protein n=1 Tax=Rhipicephalus microplus TaxID=6941 RepID=A0A9J6EDQ0_RHIMP|nr:hypothetical protein HPB51_025179 [Rhipicephalus microplus]